MVATNKNEKQIMDVSKPGKTVPSATSKPIIVGHRPMVQDPMVTSDSNAEALAPSDEEVVKPIVVSPSASKKVISPIIEEKPETTEATETTAESTTESVEESVTATEESAVVDAIVDQMGSKVPATSDEDKKNHEHIEKLITEKRYFVPLGKVNGKSTHGLLVFTLILLAIFIGLIVAIDADLLDPGFDMPFDVL